jgi:hypothetical protein
MTYGLDEAFAKFHEWCHTSVYIRFTEILDDSPPTIVTAVVTAVDKKTCSIAIAV